MANKEPKEPRIVAVDIISPPDPQGIEAARILAGLTPTEAARLMDQTYRRWDLYRSGKRTPDRRAWTLFLLAIDQHPTYRLTRRRAR